MSKDNEQDIGAEVKVALGKISDQIKEVGEKAQAEAKKGIDMSQEAKNKVDELLTKQSELMTKQKEIDARVTEVEQKGARRQNEQGEKKTLGQRFTDTEGFKNFQKEKGKRKFHMDVKAVTNITNLTTGTGAAGDAAAPDLQAAINGPGQTRLTVRDLIGAGRTSSNAVEYVKETGFQNMAASQDGQGTAKAQSDLAFDLVSTPVQTIAHWVRASKQILDDAPMLQSYIDGRLTFGLKYAEELQLLLGSNANGNLNGIYTQATAYSAPAGALVGTATIIDTIRLALLQAEIALYPSDGIVLNPTQWAAMELLKDDTGRYIIGNPQGNLAPALWGRKVVATPAMTTDKFLVGAFALGAMVFDREDANVQISTEDADNFTKNLVTIRAEERLALAVFRTEAFIKGDLGLIT